MHPPLANCPNRHRRRQLPWYLQQHLHRFRTRSRQLDLETSQRMQPFCRLQGGLDKAKNLNLWTLPRLLLANVCSLRSKTDDLSAVLSITLMSGASPSRGWTLIFRLKLWTLTAIFAIAMTDQMAGNVVVLCAMSAKLCRSVC